MTLKEKILGQQGSTMLMLLILIISITLLLYGLFQISRNHQFQFFGKLIYHVDTNEKVVALTFDDGPSHKGTEPIIGILRKHGIKGTFYLNGRSMQQHPELAKQLIDAGHEIGNHSYSHKRMVFMPYGEVAEEIESTSKLIHELGYQREIRFRPPYGKNLFMLPYYLANNDITTVTWDVEAETFNQGEDTPELIIKRTMKSVKPGSIILLHVMYGDGSTLKALPTIISRLKKRGYRFTTVGELIELSPKSLAKG
ncbi:MAG: polysaccharide deacetylase family protein [Arenicella sp.]|nr:polysaccharide deacetylase family protein [Arenicella sp.]